MEGGAEPGSLEVIALAEDVESAAAALPADRSAVTVAIAGATGSVPVQSLVVIEEARGVVDETIALAP
jgi:predicted amino acid dehydrogenase